MSAEPVPIYPPEGYSPWWWLVIAVGVLAMIAVLWWCRRTLRGLAGAGSGGDSLAAARRAALERIAAVERAHASGELPAPDAVSRLSAEVRRFAGLVTNGDADYRVLSELRRAALRDPRLAPVADFVASGQAPAFAAPAAPWDLGPVVAEARRVVERWS